MLECVERITVKALTEFQFRHKRYSHKEAEKARHEVESVRTSFVLLVLFCGLHP